MTKSIRTYRPATSWITVGLLTLVMLGFGLFAQHRADSQAIPIADGKSYFCDALFSGWCDEATRSTTKPNLASLIQSSRSLL